MDVIGKEGGPHLIRGGATRRRIELNEVTFRNVHFEERNNSRGNLGSLFWLRSDEFAGTLNNWVFEDVTLDQQFADEGCLLGSATLPYRNITFKNLRMGGKTILSAADSHISFNEHVTDVKFLPAGP